MLGHPAFPSVASGEETAGMSGEVITVYPGQEAPGSWDGCILIQAARDLTGRTAGHDA